MAYTPQLTYEDSCALRRIAWAAKIPMTEAMDQIIEFIAGQVDHAKICALCRDRTKCADCKFGRKQ